MALSLHTQKLAQAFNAKTALLCAVITVHAPAAFASAHSAENMMIEEHGSAESAAHHSSGGLPQLDPTTFEPQLFWLFVIFIGLYFFFSKRTLPEIGSVVENRRDRIQNDLDTAEKLKSEADSIRKAYEDGIAKAQAQATRYFQDAESNIREKTEKELKAFQEKWAAELEKSEKAILAARSKAISEIDDLATDLGRKAAEKIIGAKLDAAKAA